MEPDVSLDRLENPGACLLLRASLVAHFPAATRTGPERRATQHQPPTGRTRRHPGNPDRLPAPPRPTAGSCRHLPHLHDHTSELQSPCNLVCRLLLEKKKK